MKKKTDDLKLFVFMQMLDIMIEPASTPTTDRELESVESTAWNIRNSSQIYNLVDELCSIHNDLCDTCGIFSDYFSLQLVFVFGTGLMSIVTHGYFTWLYRSQGHLPDKLIEWIYTSIESIFIASTMLLACSLAQNVTDEVSLITTVDNYEIQCNIDSNFRMKTVRRMCTKF